MGVTFDGTYFGSVGGNGNGDPGNWNLEGTNGSAFLGINSGIGTGPDINFDNAVNNVSLDVGLPGFAWTNDIIASSYLNNVLVENFTVNINSPNDPGNWLSINFGSSLDRIEVRLGNGSGFAFGVDNINFENAQAIPEPLTILGTATALGFGALFKKKTAKKG